MIFEKFRWFESNNLMTPRIDVASDSSFHVNASYVRYFSSYLECIIYVVELGVAGNFNSR